MSAAYDQVHQDENVHIGSICTWTRMHTHKRASLQHPFVYASMLIRGLIYDYSGINFLVSIKTCNDPSLEPSQHSFKGKYENLSKNIIRYYPYLQPWHIIRLSTYAV